MAAHRKAAANDVKPVWDRPEPTRRPALVALSREKIVKAALAIADKDGLEAVSFRNVGAALNAGPMRLYGYVETKEELLALLVDEIYGEMMKAGPMRGDWRKALKSMAHRTRKAATEHAWFTDLLGGRPHQGPNALAYMEAVLAALSGTPGFEDIDDVLIAGATVTAFVLGSVRSEASERRAEQTTGLDKVAWQRATSDFLFRMIATGRFPTLDRVVREAKHPPFDVVFERGLDSVLDGIAARLKR